MSSLTGTTIDDGTRAGDTVPSGIADAPPSAPADLAALAGEVEQLRDCVEQLLEIVGAQPDHTDDVALLMERMAFFERRMQRAEDGLSDLSWVLRRQPGER